MLVTEGNPKLLKQQSWIIRREARISLDDIYSSIIDIYKRNLLPSAYRANPPKIYFFDMTITNQGSKTYKGL